MKQKPKVLHMFYASNIGTRETNEDNLLFPRRRIRLLKKAEVTGEKKFVLKEKGGLTFAVSDGMGGENAGEYAALQVIKGVSKTADTPRGQRASSINDQVLRLQKRYVGCGATLVCCEFRTDGLSTVVYIESVGDSSCYLVRDGQIRKITQDDTLYQHLLETGELPEDEEEIARIKSGLTQWYGKPDVETHRYKLFSEPGDVFVLCSDGVLLDAGNEPYFLREDNNPAKDLVRDSVSENKYVTDGVSDNTTAIVIKVEE